MIHESSLSSLGGISTTDSPTMPGAASPNWRRGVACPPLCWPNTWTVTAMLRERLGDVDGARRPRAGPCRTIPNRRDRIGSWPVWPNGEGTWTGLWTS